MARLKPYTPQDRYDATHTRREVIKLNLKTDADIIKALDESQEPKQTTIKKWIRLALAKEAEPLSKADRQSSQCSDR